MTTAANYRKERILRLLKELEYELVRGVMENEIEEEMAWHYLLPVCRSIPNGVVAMEFRMRPMTHYSVAASFGAESPHLRVVGEER